MNNHYFWHECVDCHTTFEPTKFNYTCSKCNGLLLVSRDEDYVKKVAGNGKTAREHFDRLRFGEARMTYPNNSGVWLWRDFILPGFPSQDIVSLNEGQTDLFEAPGWLKKDLGLNKLFIKLEGQAPSESFKDRGMPVAISDALRLQRLYPELGITGISCASTGDTSAAAAIYAGYARDKLSCLVLVPFEKVSDSQLFQAMAYGARVRAIRHPDGFDGCMKIVQEFTSTHPELVLVNSKNDMRIVGQETIGLEIIQDLAWKVPDWISIPVGNGGNLSALLNSLRRAKSFGLIDRLPGIIAAQTAAADTLVRWSESKYKDYTPGGFKDTVASAMNINDPVSFPRIKKLYSDFDIHFYRSTESAILDRWAQCTRAGAGICPQGAVAVDAVTQALESRIIKPNALVVAVSTASALKFAEVGISYHTKSTSRFANPYSVIDGSTKALEESLKEPVNHSL
jgi:threonine synthase